MNLSRTNIVLAVLLLVVVVSSLFVQRDHSRPNFQIYLGDDMTYSPAYGAYDPNQNFADGRTSQPPVPGTIARGEMPMHFEATPEGALRAGEQLKNPYVPLSDEARASAERGAAAFQVFCIACHGARGTGDGLVSMRGFPSPSLLTERVSKKEMKDGQLFYILTKGSDTDWPGRMLPFAGQLSPARRWDLVNFVRSLQQQAATATKANAGEATTDERQDAANDEIPPDEEQP